MKTSLFLQLVCISLLSLSHLATAWPWPPAFPILKTVWARQDKEPVDGNNNNNNNNNDNNNNNNNNPSDTEPSNIVPSQTSSNQNNDENSATSTALDVKTGTITNAPKATMSGHKSESQTTSGSKSYDARLPAGGVSMLTPAISLGQQYFKIGDYVTFGWNYTSLEATPTAVNIMATCSANKQLYTIQMNQTVANNTGLVVWDTGNYQATAVQNPLLTQTYTLIIFDSKSSISATAQPGYLATYSQYTFGMYSPQPYTPLGDFKCVTCNGGLSDLERNALWMTFGMSLITISSFTYFVRRFSVIW